MGTSTATKTWQVRLSALWMDDHLDVWEADCDMPDGTFKGKTWIGTITEDQGKEIISRCRCYDSREGFERDAWKYVSAAQRTLKALQTQAPELFQHN